VVVVVVGVAVLVGGDGCDVTGVAAVVALG